MLLSIQVQVSRTTLLSNVTATTINDLLNFGTNQKLIFLSRKKIKLNSVFETNHTSFQQQTNSICL